MTAPLTPRERVEALDCERAPDTNGHEGWMPAYFSMLTLSRQLAAELEEANRRREADILELRRETELREKAQATCRHYESALYFPGIKPCAVPDGNDAVEINPCRVAEIIDRAEAAERQLAEANTVIKGAKRALEDWSSRYGEWSIMMPDRMGSRLPPASHSEALEAIATEETKWQSTT